MTLRLIALPAAALCVVSAFAQPGILTRDLLIQYTSDWKGERFADGRPKVPDDILRRMKAVTLEEAWAQLRTAGFNHQYEDGWYSIHPDKVLVGRALTAQWLPGRPDIQKIVEQQGKKDGRIGGQNAWPVDRLPKWCEGSYERTKDVKSSSSFRPLMSRTAPS